MFGRITLEPNDEKTGDIDVLFISSSLMKFITKSKEYLTSDAQIEGLIPDGTYIFTTAVEK